MLRMPWSVHLPSVTKVGMACLHSVSAAPPVSALFVRLGAGEVKQCALHRRIEASCCPLRGTSVYLEMKLAGARGVPCPVPPRRAPRRDVGDELFASRVLSV